MYDIVFASKHRKNRKAYEEFAGRYPSARWLTDVKTLSDAVKSASSMCV